ncbi:hypothetical protein Aperf_G00000021623 [Anoplocephala perfoliata]
MISWTSYQASGSTKSTKKRRAEESDDTEISTPKRIRTSKAFNESTKNVIKAQNDELWRLRDRLDKYLSRQELVDLLEYNDQTVPTGRSALLDALADAMIFGALPPCPNDGAPLRLADGKGGYQCSRRHDNWAPCLFTATDSSSIKRRVFRIPKEYHDIPFLKRFKSKPRERLFAAAHSNAMCPFSPKRFDAKRPLEGLHFLLDRGPFLGGMRKRDLAAKIRSLGGTVLSSVAPGGVFVTTDGVEFSNGNLASRARSGRMRPLSSSRILDESLMRKLSSREHVHNFIADDPLVSIWDSSGGRYYCEYCDTSFPDSLVNRRNHLSGARHVQLRREYLRSYEDAGDILAAEQSKRPCINFQRTGSCQYGTSCRYSHLTMEEFLRLQAIARPVEDPLQAIWEVEEMVKIRREKYHSQLLPRGCDIRELPPSIQRALNGGCVY